jgi:hypothetical protein
MIKLDIAIPVNGRFHIAKLVIDSLQKHRQYWQKEIQIRIFLGTDQAFFKEIADELPWAITAVELKNTPLGDKFNKLCDAAAAWGDYFVLLGSDDILSPDYFLLAAEAIELNKTWAALNQCYITDVKTLETKFVRLDEGYIGGGLLTRSESWNELREKYGDVYPADQNKGLDGQAFGRYGEHLGKCWVMNSFSPLLLTVKSQDNIWPFFMFKEFPPFEFLKLQDRFINSDIFAVEKYSKLLNSLEQYETEKP